MVGTGDVLQNSLLFIGDDLRKIPGLAVFPLKFRGRSPVQCAEQQSLPVIPEFRVGGRMSATVRSSR